MPSSDPAPADPMTQLGENATMLHELYLSYVAGGFTSWQAMYLVGQFVREVIRNTM